MFEMFFCSVDLDPQKKKKRSEKNRILVTITVNQLVIKALIQCRWCRELCALK